MASYIPSKDMIELEWVPYIGSESGLVDIFLLGRFPVTVQEWWVPAVRAMERVLIATGYENPCDWIGSYYKRNVAGTKYWSWHATGGAIDLDYGGDNPASPNHPLIDRNPHLHRRIYPGDAGFGVAFQLLEHQVRAIEDIRTVSGAQVWRWLGWSIGDTMHFSPGCTPDQAKEGIVIPMYEVWANELFQSWDARQIELLEADGRFEGKASYWISFLGRTDLSSAERKAVAHFVATVLANI